MNQAFGFEPVKTKIASHKGRQAKERKVIKGIIHKQCAICHEWIPESEYNKNTGSSDAKQCYCRKCQLLYQLWRRATLKKYKVQRLQDIPGFVQPERGQEMKRYVHDLIQMEVIKDEE